MFVFNVKFSPAKKLITLLAVTSVAVAVICIICMINVHSSVPGSATCDELGSFSLSAETADEQIEFLSRFGITVDEDGKKLRNITVPAEFNDTYDEYNELQRAIGLDLKKFSGKNVQEITYTTNNSKYKYAVILVYKGKVIGAHLTNGEYGGKNQPLTKLWTDSTK